MRWGGASGSLWAVPQVLMVFEMLATILKGQLVGQ